MMKNILFQYYKLIIKRVFFLKLTNKDKFYENVRSIFQKMHCLGKQTKIEKIEVDRKKKKRKVLRERKN